MKCEILRHAEEVAHKSVCCDGACENCPFVNNDSIFPKKEIGEIKKDLPVEVSYEEMLQRAMGLG